MLTTFWVAVLVACATPNLPSCEVFTTQELFASQDECLAWIGKRHDEQHEQGRYSIVACTDINPPQPKGEDL